MPVAAHIRISVLQRQSFQYHHRVARDIHHLLTTKIDNRAGRTLLGDQRQALVINHQLPVARPAVCARH